MELIARVLAASREAVTPAAGWMGSVQTGSSRRPVRGAVTLQDPLAIWHFQLCFSVSPRKSRASWWLCGWVGTASLPSSSTWSPGSLTWRGPQSVCLCRSSLSPQTPECGQSQLVSPTSWKFTRVLLVRRVERHLFCPP